MVPQLVCNYVNVQCMMYNACQLYPTCPLYRTYPLYPTCPYPTPRCVAVVAEEPRVRGRLFPGRAKYELDTGEFVLQC